MVKKKIYLKGMCIIEGGMRCSWNEVDSNSILRLKVTATLIDRNRSIEREKMWVFYLISLPLTMGMVLFTLRYFAGPSVPLYVLFTVGYTWFVSLSIIILVPADIWLVLSPFLFYPLSIKENFESL